MAVVRGDSKGRLKADARARDGEEEPGVAEEVSQTVQYHTVIPTFDPRQYAVESETRDRMPTMTDEVALEHARLLSFPSSLPPRRAMPTLPGTASSGDLSVELDADEADLEALGDDDQIAILRANLMPLTRVPMLARPMSELGSITSDPKAAYVLGFIDAILPLETIIDVTGLHELDTLRVLDELVTQGIVTFRPTRARR